MKKNKLLVAVFSSGFGVMVLELVGARVVSPYLGTSLYVWTAMIGVMMGAITVGYYLGGKQSEKFSSLGIISQLLMWSGVGIFVTALGKEVFLQGLVNLVVWERLQTVLATVGLFGFPGILLGAVFPIASKMAIKSVKGSGFEVGKLYAISTIGSIAGTFATGFWLVPLLGNLRILLGMAMVLVAVSWVLTQEKWLVKLGLIFLFGWGFLQSWSVKTMETENVILDTDTSYYRVRVRDKVTESGTERSMEIGQTFQSGVIMGKSEVLAFPYYKFYDLMTWHIGKPERVLMIGGAGMGYPAYALKKYPKTNLTVVEIDEGLYKLATEKMGFSGGEKLQMIFEDGRVFLNKNTQQFDAILFDVFSEYTIPAHLATQEAVERIEKGLTPKGVVVVNLLGSLEGRGSEVVRAVYSTYKNVFTDVKLFTVSYPPNELDKLQNIILVAANKKLDFADNDLGPEEKSMLANYAENVQPGLVLTDDWSPVESFSYKMLN